MRMQDPRICRHLTQDDYSVCVCVSVCVLVCVYVCVYACVRTRLRACVRCVCVVCF